MWGHRVTGVGRKLYFNCWVTMESGNTEAAGALFHCGARPGHPGSWSQDHLGTDGGVLPLARIGRFVALWVKKTKLNRVRRTPNSAQTIYVTRLQFMSQGSRDVTTDERRRCHNNVNIQIIVTKISVLF